LSFSLFNVNLVSNPISGESYCWSIALDKADCILLVPYFVTDGVGA